MLAHHNNFDFLRLLFAILVIITHSYTLTGVFYNDGMYQLTNKQITFSRIGLYGFFTISGYLILQSLNNSSSLSEYYIKRVLRIFPGLFVVLVLTVIFFSLLSNTFSPIGYFTLSKEPYTYVISNLLPFGPFQGTILDTIKNNPYPVFINASIWTLRYEVLFYIVLSSIFFIRRRKQIVNLLLAVTFIVLYVLRFHDSNFLQFVLFNQFNIEPDTFILASQQTNYKMTGFRPFALIDFGLYFTAGALLSSFRFDSYKNKGKLASILFIVSLIAIAYNIYVLLEVFMFPVIILTIGLANTKWIGGLNSKIGDLSYGVYIYGFVIQQVLLHFFDFNQLELTLATIPIALIAGYFSWNLIEKRFIRLKNSKQVEPRILVSR
ncbi:acyltransferase [Pontibacter sp. SGAir0037]|uniref:acyltransferase family protein n=1 Tax=Pontibacter sp. SGAir0037 TaxID=2571030 RepID=UPI0010CD3090|nr:acyltransferase [Pontibacter sp. SGAir0037]QCR22180.1 hypothetical protein C1N53_07380 [Pontibacter sp. SGAir0037]